MTTVFNPLYSIRVFKLFMGIKLLTNDKIKQYHLVGDEASARVVVDLLVGFEAQHQGPQRLEGVGVGPQQVPGQIGALLITGIIS